MNGRSPFIVAALCVGCVVGTGASGCATQEPAPVDFTETVRNYRARDYEPVRQSWTRKGKIVRDVGTVIELWATLKSWDFRQAFVEFYSEVYGLSDADRSALRDQQMASARDGFEFHVTAQSTNYKWNDFQDKDSAWKITLVDSTGAELAPSSIEVLKLPELYEMKFFPTRTDFSKSYVIRFKPSVAEEGTKPFKGAESGRITLRVTGPMGKTDLVWRAQ